MKRPVFTIPPETLCIRNQSVPQCKHFPPRLFKDQKQSALYKKSVRTAL